MDLLVIAMIAVSLAMDAFSVCVAAGVKISTPNYRHYFRLSFHFGLFQFLMPVAGYYSGVLVAELISSYDHWIALVLLSFIGIKMIRESFTKNDDDDKAGQSDPSRGLTLILLSIATSIDAAAVGFSFAALEIPVLIPAVFIGIICLLLSAAGLYLGSKIGSRTGVWAERFGGVILIFIGFKILFEHLQ